MLVQKIEIIHLYLKPSHCLVSQQGIFKPGLLVLVSKLYKAKIVFKGSNKVLMLLTSALPLEF